MSERVTRSIGFDGVHPKLAEGLSLMGWILSNKDTTERCIEFISSYITFTQVEHPGNHNGSQASIASSR